MNVLLITTDQQRADTLGVVRQPALPHPAPRCVRGAGHAVLGAARTQNPLCQPARATILTGTYPSTHGVTCNGIDLPAEPGGAVGGHRVRARRAIAPGCSARRTSRPTFPFLPTGQLESVEGSARVDPELARPVLRLRPRGSSRCSATTCASRLMGRWNWCFGPPPFGLHYGRYLFRDGVERGNERVAAMQPEAAGAEWDHTQTWRNELAEEDHPTTWTADLAIDWLRGRGRGRRSVLRLGELHRPASPDGPARAVVRHVRRPTTCSRCCRSSATASSTTSRRSTRSGAAARGAAASSGPTRAAARSPRPSSRG